MVETLTGEINIPKAGKDKPVKVSSGHADHKKSAAPFADQEDFANLVTEVDKIMAGPPDHVWREITNVDEYEAALTLHGWDTKGK